MRNPSPLGITGRHIPALDGLRATAAWLVILSHLRWAPRLTNGLGQLGVQIFFAISGFLITWLLLSELAETGGISLRAFYWRRTIRIFPAFYVTWAASIAVYSWLGIPSSGRIFSAFYCQDLYLAWAFRTHHPMTWFSAHSFMFHSWSLGIEEKFYLLWPLCVRALRRRLRRLTGIALGLVVSEWAYRAIALGANVEPSFLYFSPESRLDGLMAGCALALMARQGAWNGLFLKLALQPRYAAFTAMALLGSQFLSMSARWYALVGIAFQTALTTLLLIQLIQLAPRSGWGWLDSRPAKFFAGISYSLYLWHFTVAMATDRLLEMHPVAESAFAGHLLLHSVKSAAIVGFSFLFAVASYALIERPCLRWRRPGSKRPPVFIGDAKTEGDPAPANPATPTP